MKVKLLSCQNQTIQLNLQSANDHLRKFRCGNDSFKVFRCRQNLRHAKKSRYCETSTYYEDSKILTKSLNDQIDFLKSEIKSKNAIITMILDYHKNEMRQPK